MSTQQSRESRLCALRSYWMFREGLEMDHADTSRTAVERRESWREGVGWG